jgi:hypothetical protein
MYSSAGSWDQRGDRMASRSITVDLWPACFPQLAISN